MKASGRGPGGKKSVVEQQEAGLADHVPAGSRLDFAFCRDPSFPPAAAVP
jgi:hypothetical protein